MNECIQSIDRSIDIQWNVIETELKPGNGHPVRSDVKYNTAYKAEVRAGSGEICRSTSDVYVHTYDRDSSVLILLIEFDLINCISYQIYHYSVSSSSSSSSSSSFSDSAFSASSSSSSSHYYYILWYWRREGEVGGFSAFIWLTH